MAATSFAALAVYAGCDRCGNTATSKNAAVQAPAGSARGSASAGDQKKTAQRFFEHMRAHRFAKAYAMFETSLAKVSTVAQLDKTWRELESSLGGVERVEPVKTRTTAGHQVHLYRCHGKRAAGNVKVMTRASGGQIAGFFVTGSGLKSSASPRGSHEH